MSARSVRIAVIGGDGIGPEVVAEAVKVLRAAVTDVADRDHQLRPGRGALASAPARPCPTRCWPRSPGTTRSCSARSATRACPSGVLERGLVLRLRFELDQYVNLRPVRLYPGVASPLSGLRADSVDMLVVREGTEGPYIEAGGVLRKGTAGEVATQESINTAFGVGRVTRYALPARRRPAAPEADPGAQDATCSPTPATCGGAPSDQLAKEFSEVAADYCHMDAASMYFVTQPDRFDVIVTDNLFGDILTALGAAIAGGIGLAASASINPERTAPEHVRAGARQRAGHRGPAESGSDRGDPVGRHALRASRPDRRGSQDRAGGRRRPA